MRALPFWIFLTLFHGVRLYAQTQEDSLQLRQRYFEMSDSLIELGQYEKARDYLYTGSSYRPQNIGVKSRKDYVEDYQERRRKIDVLLTYELTDSVRYQYRMEKGYEWLNTYNSPQVAAYYFNEAQKYTDNSTEAEAQLRTIINLLPTDTIIINAHNTGSLQLLQKQERHQISSLRPFLGSIQTHPSFLDTFYLRKDTTLFNGTIIKDKVIQYIGDSKSYTYWEFKDGIVQSQVTFSYCPDPIKAVGSIEEVLYQGMKEEELIKKGFYLCSRDDHLNRKTVHFYPNGDTSTVLFTTSLNDSVTKEVNQSWYENGQLKEHGISTYNKKTGEGIDFFYFKLSKNKDTTELIQYINNWGVLNGRQIRSEYYGKDSLISFITYWKNDKLIDYVNDDILFFDEKLNLISEEEFMQIANMSISNSPEYLVSTVGSATLDEIESSQLIAYPNRTLTNGGRNGDKLRKKLCKIITKMEME